VTQNVVSYREEPSLTQRQRRLFGARRTLNLHEPS